MSFYKLKYTMLKSWYVFLQAQAHYSSPCVVCFDWTGDTCVWIDEAEQVRASCVIACLCVYLCFICVCCVFVWCFLMLFCLFLCFVVFCDVFSYFSCFGPDM